MLPKSLPINNFSIFKVDSGSSSAVFIPGGRKREIRRENTHIHTSGQSLMQDYLTVPKTIFKTEDNAHIFHQHIPQENTGYSLGNSSETIKTRGKQEPIHSPTNATNTSKTLIRGLKDLKLVSRSVLAYILFLVREVQRTRQKLSTRAQYIGFSVVGKWKVFYAILNPSAKVYFILAVVEYWL